MAAIQARNLTKIYRLYASPRDRLLSLFGLGRSRNRHDFYAVNDVSFTVEKGETLGIVGRNGSGKSTLLQIVCGVLQATSGALKVDGRIAALLELGAGFNPEFTGRDNVHMNGALMGFTEKEMSSRMEDIEGFADIGEFMDQPVKTYSSGMFVRLAFAAAINVDPDILVVDEALSVGDSLFQSKCFAKFRQFQNEGKTIIFVTHALNLITTHCNRALLLDRGSLVESGDPKRVVDAYNRILTGSDAPAASPGGSAIPGTSCPTPSSQAEWRDMFEINPTEERYGSKDAEILEAGIFTPDGRPVQILERNREYLFKVKVRHNRSMRAAVVACSIKNPSGTLLCGTNTMYQDVKIDDMQKGDVVLVTFRQVVHLNPGDYLLCLGCASMEGEEMVLSDRRFDYMSFRVTGKGQRVGFVDPNASIEWTRCST